MRNLKIKPWAAALLVGFLLFGGRTLVRGSDGSLNELTAADEDAIRATIAVYRTAWLANDTKGVLKTFTDDAVLLPAHGAPAVVGMAAIEKY